jgi:hypothetical protein
MHIISMFQNKYIRVAKDIKRLAIHMFKRSILSKAVQKRLSLCYGITRGQEHDHQVDIHLVRPPLEALNSWELSFRSSIT